MAVAKKTTTFIALLRAINVGGTGMLPMKELSALCTELGFEKVRTYIQSGNVVFESADGREKVTTEMEAALERKTGKKIDVMVRTAAELKSVLEANPFFEAQGSKVAVLFLPGSAPKTLPASIAIGGKEEIRLGKSEVYVYYPEGMGKSKLKLQALGVATARNINTVAKLVALSAV